MLKRLVACILSKRDTRKRRQTQPARADSHCKETESFPAYLQRQRQLARWFPPFRVAERENRLLALWQGNTMRRTKGRSWGR